MYFYNSPNLCVCVCVLNHKLLYMYIQEMWKNTVAYDTREFWMEEKKLI